MKRNNSKLIFSHSINYQAPEQLCVGTCMQCSCLALNFHPPSGTLPHDNIFDYPEKDSCDIFIPFSTEILSNLKYCNLVTGETVES